MAGQDFPVFLPILCSHGPWLRWFSVLLSLTELQTGFFPTRGPGPPSSYSSFSRKLAVISLFLCPFGTWMSFQPLGSFMSPQDPFSGPESPAFQTKSPGHTAPPPPTLREKAGVRDQSRSTDQHWLANGGLITLTNLPARAPPQHLSTAGPGLRPSRPSFQQMWVPSLGLI